MSARVCVFGTYDSRRHPRVEVLVDGLRAHGYDVVECNEPWDAPTSLRVAGLRSPRAVLVLLWRLLRAWAGLRRRARTVRTADVVVVGYLGVLDIHLVRRWITTDVVVLDHLAPVGGVVEDRATVGLRSQLASRCDAAALRRADLVVVDTEEHATTGRPTVVVPVGAAEAWFEAGARRVPRAPGAPLHVVFFGLFTPLQGTVTIARALRHLEQARGVALRATLVGDGQDHPQCRQLLAGSRSVSWHRWLAADDLRQLVGGADVCLGVFGTTPKASRVVPTKVYQGAAAGCAVVTSDTPPQRRVLGDGAMFVPPGDPAALAAALHRLAADASLLAHVQSASRRAGERYRPVSCVQPLVDALDVPT